MLQVLKLKGNPLADLPDVIHHLCHTVEMLDVEAPDGDNKHNMKLFGVTKQMMEMA